MRKSLLFFLIVLPIFQGASILDVSGTPIEFYHSECIPMEHNITHGQRTLIIFHARWIPSNIPFNNTYFPSVYFGANSSTEERDSYILADYDLMEKYFFVNISFYEKVTVIFYIADVYVRGEEIDFTQSAGNITIHWQDEIIIQPTDNNPFRSLTESDKKTIGIISGALVGSIAALLIFFDQKSKQGRGYYDL